jgi:DNA primase
MAFNALGIQNIEGVVPDSENSLLPDSLIAYYKEKYTKIITLLDNDKAGISAMEKYKEKHGINYVIPPAEKDIADCVKVHGIKATRDKLLPLLKQAL